MRFLVTIFVVLLQQAAQAQSVTEAIHPLFQGKLDGDKIRESYDNFEVASHLGKPGFRHKYNNVQISLFHSKSLYVYTGLTEYEKLPELDQFKYTFPKDQGYASISSSYDVRAVPLFDSLPVIVTAYGVNHLNKDLYRFRVLLNQKEEIVPWSRIRFFSPVYMFYRYNEDGTEQKEMAYIGAFNVPVNNSVTIEIKNINRADTVYKLAAIWIKRAPKAIATFTQATIKDFLSVYKFQWKYDQWRLHGATYYGDIELKPVDSLLKIRQSFKHYENNLFIYLKDKIKSSDLVEYKLVSGKNSSAWHPNIFDNNVIWLQDLKPGDYTLFLRYAFQRQTVSTFTFSIQPAWFQTSWFKIGLVIVVLSFIALLFNLYKSATQKRALRQQIFKRQQAEIGLKSIRSQFNPHFVFNALNSIQGLVQKNDQRNVAKYLSEFSQLMRESLRAGSKEMVSIDQEIKMLGNYLELEKLRFGFSYEIVISPEINVHAVEIPVLLLQPVVENAIKHGISGMYGDGKLKIRITKNINDMEVLVTDNGKGFDLNKEPNGLGIKLTKDRITLLSEINPSHVIEWAAKSGEDGTTINLTFKNWLA